METILFTWRIWQREKTSKLFRDILERLGALHFTQGPMTFLLLVAWVDKFESGISVLVKKRKKLCLLWNFKMLHRFSEIFLKRGKAVDSSGDFSLFQGGSEVWNAESETVIASLAFHPSERLLVIATYNEIHFWDWSKPQPYAFAITRSEKEKVRSVEKLSFSIIFYIIQII